MSDLRLQALLSGDADGTPGRPLEVQMEAAQVLRTSGRLIARLPTGTGKTLLAALPFAGGLLQPKQMVFMTPLRTLTGAQARALRGQINPSVARECLGLSWEVREQTGAMAEDPLFAATATICTFDQALSSALQIAYSASARRRTINAGAVLSAYLVADELHLFPRNQALTTLLWFLKNRPDLPFCLMTATLTEPMAEQLADHLDADLISGLPTADAAFLGVDSRTRSLHWQAEPFDAEQITRLAQEHRRLLVVVNTVDRAIQLGREVRRAFEGTSGSAKIWVLHSRYYSDDRDRITEEVMTVFGRGDQQLTERGICIATQVVEAGLDISADIMLTELALANALIQRWGRCARWGGDGLVVVAPPPDDRVFPYISEEDAPLVKRTREWLETNAGTPILADRDVEQHLLDVVHAEADGVWLGQLGMALKNQTVPMGQAIVGGEYMLAGKLIRDINQRTILVHDRPNAIANPYGYQGFSLSPGRIWRIAKEAGIPAGAMRPIPSEDLQDEDGAWEPDLGLPGVSGTADAGWVFQVPVWRRDQPESERSAALQVSWHPVERRRELHNQPVLLIHPSFVAYDPDLGLEMRAGDNEAMSPGYFARPSERRRPSWTSFSYRSETYEAHIERMLAVLDDPARPLWSRIEPIAERIERWLGWPPGMLRRVVEAAFVFHDAGKLTEAWQDGIRTIQERQQKPYCRWLVHSDFDPNGPRFPQPKLPPHARVGAAYSVFTGKLLDDEVRAACMTSSAIVPPQRVIYSAVLTHHNPNSHPERMHAEELLTDAAQLELLRLVAKQSLPAKLPPLRDGTSTDACAAHLEPLANDNVAKEVFALAVITRLLRLADGWSQEKGGEPEAH